MFDLGGLKLKGSKAAQREKGKEPDMADDLTRRAALMAALQGANAAISSPNVTPSMPQGPGM